MPFGLVVGEFVLPLLLEVIVLLVVDWKVLTEVLHEVFLQEILPPPVQNPYKLIVDLVGVLIGVDGLFIFSFVFISGAEGSDRLRGFG